MDFVPNHTSSAHPYYLDIQRKGEASPYYGFYDRDEFGRITHYFDWENLVEDQDRFYRSGVKGLLKSEYRSFILTTGTCGIAEVPRFTRITYYVHHNEHMFLMNTIHDFNVIHCLSST